MDKKKILVMEGNRRMWTYPAKLLLRKALKGITFDNEYALLNILILQKWSDL